MPITDHQRRDLYDSLARALGRDEADALMELLPPVGWADVARQGDIAQLRNDLRAEMVDLRGELRGEMAELRGEMAELRGEIAELRGHVDRRFAQLLWANLATMVGLLAGVAGLATVL